MNLFQHEINHLHDEIENQLSEKVGQKVTIQSSDILGGGCINHASKIETNVGAFFLKWNSNCADDIFLREAESLNELKKAAGDQLIIPKVYTAKKVDETPGFLVLEYLHTSYSLAGDDEKLGRGLAVIHKFSNSENGFYNDNYCGATHQNNNWNKNWPEFYRDNRLLFLLGLIQNERPLPVSEMKIYEKLIQKIPEIIPEESTPVLIHGDLWSGNYMITEKGPALIDPASYFANREMEFAIITMFGGFSQLFYDAYNEINPLSKEWKMRNSFYQLYHILNHYYLFGGGYQSQAIRIARSFVD